MNNTPYTLDMNNADNTNTLVITLTRTGSFDRAIFSHPHGGECTYKAAGVTEEEIKGMIESFAYEGGPDFPGFTTTVS